MRTPRGALPTLGALAVAAALAVASLSIPSASAAPAADDATGAAADLTAADRDGLKRTAKDTWRSFTAMVDPGTGLVSDNVGGDLAPGSKAAYTSPTNVGTYLWSTVVARDLKFIGDREARDRMAQTLATLARLEKHEPSGMYYNWYSPSTGEKLTTWPVDGSVVHPFLSSVDNGWLATALKIVRVAEPRLRDQADAVLSTMNFGFYYNPDANPDAGPGFGQIRGGFWDAPPPGCFVEGSGVFFTCHHYGALNTEPRIASYLGIASGQIPPQHYFGMFRTLLDNCDWGWQEQKPTGQVVEHMGGKVFEGTYGYRGMSLVPTWGGSMFEALMVPLFVPEERWGKKSWGRNHPVTVQAQIEHGMNEAKYGYWGFSPANNPDGGYREYGVDPIGMEANGYTSDQERTTVDLGFEGCREALPEPTTYGRGVVTPHASFLAMPYAPRAALSNLDKLRKNHDAYGPGGYYDTVDVTTGKVSKYYLALDQGMIMAQLGNLLSDDSMRRYFVKGDVEKALKPLLGMEEWAVEGAR
jgi:Putative glucoamylase/Protein of unknown function (DUF3131)